MQLQPYTSASSVVTLSNITHQGARVVLWLRSRACASSVVWPAINGTLTARLVERAVDNRGVLYEAVSTAHEPQRLLEYLLCRMAVDILDELIVTELEPRMDRKDRDKINDFIARLRAYDATPQEGTEPDPQGLQAST